MNEMPEHLNSFSFELVSLFFLGSVALFACVLLTGLLFWLVMLLSSFRKKHFILMTSYRITTFSMLRVWMLWFFDSSIVRKQIDFLFFVLDFNLDFHVINKFNINNENLSKQCTYSIHVNRIKYMLHPKRQVFKRINKWILRKEVFYIYFFGVKQRR